MNRRPPTAKRGGRAKGTPNKRTAAQLRKVSEILEEHGFDPIEAMALIGKGDVVACGFMTQAEYDQPALRVRGTLVRVSGREKAREMLPLSLRFQAAKELAQFVYPKRHSVAHTDPNGQPLQAGVVVMLPPNGR